MVMIGMYFILFFMVMLYFLYKKDMVSNRWLYVALWSLPLAYLASQLGWWWPRWDSPGPYRISCRYRQPPRHIGTKRGHHIHPLRSAFHWLADCRGDHYGEADKEGPEAKG